MSRRLPRTLVVGLPLVMLLSGGGAGWLLRDDAITETTTAFVDDPGNLDASARPLPAAPNPAVVDTTAVIGFDREGSLVLAPGSALALPLAVGAPAVVVGATSFEPVPALDAIPAPAVTEVAPQDANALPPLDAPPSTLLAPDNTLAEITPPGNGAPSFVDPCVADPDQCSGARGVVTDPSDTNDSDTNDSDTNDSDDSDENDSDASLAPLQVSLPFAAAAGFAQLCSAVEGDGAPDSFLSPSVRPTVAVLVNQPATLALTGTWADGTELEKATMVTLPAHDAEWRRAWVDDGEQLSIVACVTLPLEAVRARATGGEGNLRADVLAISATGRAATSGQVRLDIPTDGNDPLFVDRLTVASLGEQRIVDGVLHPTVHVHYAFLTDAVIPPGSGLDPTSTLVVGRHAFVEGADCSGWAVNQQGRDRTAAARFDVRTEARTVAGRDRVVTVVDGEVHLDPTMPSGWQGQFCVWLTTTDQRAERFTLALRGALVRAPRSADYAFEVLLDDSDFPADQQLLVAWETPGSDEQPAVALCTPTALGNGGGQVRGSSCPTLARLVPDGVVITLRALDARGVAQPVVAVQLPANTAFCNPDDQNGAPADGCSTGARFVYELPLPDGSSVRVVLIARRGAPVGALWQDPAHAWRIGPTTSFVF